MFHFLKPKSELVGPGEEAFLFGETNSLREMFLAARVVVIPNDSENEQLAVVRRDQRTKLVALARLGSCLDQEDFSQGLRENCIFVWEVKERQERI